MFHLLRFLTCSGGRVEVQNQFLVGGPKIASSTPVQPKLKTAATHTHAHTKEVSQKAGPQSEKKKFFSICRNLVKVKGKQTDRTRQISNC